MELKDITACCAVKWVAFIYPIFNGKILTSVKPNHLTKCYPPSFFEG